MDLKCKFETQYWSALNKILYTCHVTSALISGIDNRVIQSFTGVHEKDKTDNDVEAIFYEETEISFFPRGLHKIFPRLLAIRIYHCGLKELTKDDLEGLENLERLNLCENDLETLPSNLFEGMSKLKKIDFSGNELEFLSSNLFRPIMNNKLTSVSFCDNKNIDVFYNPGYSESVADLDALMNIIDENCEMPEGEEVEQQN